RATVIEVGEAGSVENVDFAVSTKLKPRTITAQIVWPDGTPARFVHTWCSPTGHVPWQHMLTNGKGQIIFPAMDGLTYEIGAAAASDYEVPSRRRFSALPVRVPPGESSKVRLVLSIPPHQ